jgi:WD40 repeat protein
MDTPSPSDVVSGLINKQPIWKASPGGPSRYINSVAVSAEGARVVAGTYLHSYHTQAARRAPAAVSAAPQADSMFGTYCYNAAGQVLWQDEFLSAEGIYWVALSADGTRAAAGGGTPQGGFVRAYDATSGRVMLNEVTARRVNQVALSGDGTWLAVAAHTLRLLRNGPTSYAPTAEFASPSGESIVSAGISDDGSVVVFADYAGYIGVLFNQGGTLTLRAKFKTPASFCHMISLTPDGKHFAAGGPYGEFYYFNVASFISTQLPTLTYQTGVKEAVYGVAISPDGSLFAGVVNDGASSGLAYLVPVAGGAAPVPALSTLGNPNSAAISVAGGFIRLVIATGHPDGTPGHYYMFSCPTGGGQPLLRVRWVFGTGNMSWPIVFSASGNAIVGGSDDSHVYYFTP